MFADQETNKNISYLEENIRNILITEFRLNVDKIQMIWGFDKYQLSILEELLKYKWIMNCI